MKSRRAVRTDAEQSRVSILAIDYAAIFRIECYAPIAQNPFTDELVRQKRRFCIIGEQKVPQ